MSAILSRKRYLDLNPTARKYLFLPILLAVFFAATVSAFGADHYVATNGNDSNPGTLDRPWRTISYANGHIAEGDTVYVRGGNYTPGITINASGSGVGHETKFVAYPGETPVLDGGGGQYFSSITISGDYILVDGFEIKNVTGDSFAVTINGSYNILRNIYAHHLDGNGINANYGGYGHNLIENCEIAHYALDAVNLGAAIYLNRQNGTIVRGCYVHDGGDGEGIDVQWGSQGCTVEYCTIVDTKSAGIYSVFAYEITIRYNLLYSTSNMGHYAIAIENEGWAYDQYRGRGWNHDYYVYGNMVAGYGTSCLVGNAGGHTDEAPKNVYIYNNTFVEAYSVGLQISDSRPNPDSIYVANNIIQNTLGGKLATVPPGGKYSHNLWSGQPDADAAGEADIIGDPRLAKTTGWHSLTDGGLTGKEFALQSDSPAINKGTSSPVSNPETKFLDVVRSDFSARDFALTDQQSGWDIGAAVYATTQTQLNPPTGLRIENVF